jgi:tRNA pseudouridine38-40 synthase
MRNIKLTIEYDGANYHGWQSQINAVAIQDVVQKKIEKLTGEEITLIGASRTDVGVHAYGQTANFTTTSSIPSEKFSFALNKLLPNDIVIKRSEEVCAEFHSRFWAKGKRYRYIIYNSLFRSALLRNRAYHVPVKLDFEAMEEASKCFIGRHDFAAFRSTGGNAKTSERTVHDAILKKEFETIEFEISGDGFLYNMVRIITGTLVEVGMGRIAACDIPDIIKSLDRRRAGRTAPAHGLYLLEVYY